MLIKLIFDHQMYFCVMNENVRKPLNQSKLIGVKILNEESISNFQNKIAKLEIHNKLDKNSNKDQNKILKFYQRCCKTQKANTFQNKFQSSINVDIRSKNV